MFSTESKNEFGANINEAIKQKLISVELLQLFPKEELYRLNLYRTNYLVTQAKLYMAGELVKLRVPSTFIWKNRAHTSVQSALTELTANHFLHENEEKMISSTEGCPNALNYRATYLLQRLLAHHPHIGEIFCREVTQKRSFALEKKK